MRRGRSPDALALTFAVAVHGGVFLLLMLEWFHAPQPRTQRSALVLFDVGVPPPPPLPKPTHQPPPKKPATLLPGGSRPAAAPPILKPVDAAPPSPMLFPPRRWPVTPPIVDGKDDALLADARSSDAGEPGGGGEGTGTGTGNGVGAGSLRFARAEWIRQPDLDEVKQYLPRTARAPSVMVSVELGCMVPKPGKPKRCWLVSENPRGFGFGHAAVEMSSTFRIRPVAINDRSVDLPVLVPLFFDVIAHPSQPKP